MGSIRQKSRARRRKKQVQQHRRSMLGISAVILLLAVMVTVSSVELRAKNNAYIEQEQELEADIQAEKERAEEISDLEEYVGTDEYVEQQAKDRLGLVHEHEIIFKAKYSCRRRALGAGIPKLFYYFGFCAGGERCMGETAAG